MDEVARALVICYGGGPREVLRQAQEVVERAASTPGFVEFLVGIVASPGDEMLRLAAAIQLRKVGGVSVRQCMELVMGSPPLVQVQLKLLMKAVVAECGEFGELLGEAMELVEQGIGGVIVLRYLVKMAPRVVPGIGDREAVCKRVVAVLGALGDAVRGCGDTLLVHEVLMLVNQVCLDAVFDVGPWLMFIKVVLENETKWESYPYLDKDACRLADSLLMLQRETVPVQMFVDVFVAMCERIRRGLCSYQGMVMCCSYFLQFAMCRELWQSICEVVPRCLEDALLVFVPTSEDMQSIREDMLAFATKFDVSIDGGVDSPVSGFACFLAKAVARQENVIDQALEFAAHRLQSGNEFEQAGAIIFVAYALAIITRNECRDPTLQIIERFLEALKPLATNGSTPFLQGIFYFFLGHVNSSFVTDINTLLLCFHMLLSTTSMILRYNTAAAIGNLITPFAQQKSSLVQTMTPPAVLKAVVSILELNHSVPTETMSSTVSRVVGVFTDELIDAAPQVVEELLSVYGEYALADGDNFSQVQFVHTTLLQFISSLKVSDAQLFLSLIERVCNLASQISIDHYEEICDLLLAIITTSPSVTNEYGAITPILKQMATNDSGDSLDLISKVLQTLINRAPSLSAQPEVIQGIADICAFSLQTLLDGDFSALDSAIRLCQSLFITLKDVPLVRELFPMILELASSINDPGFADGYAALATFDPSATFSNDCNFKIWLHHSSPQAFLASAPAVLASSLPQDKIRARMRELM